MKMHEDPPAVISHAAHPSHMLTLVTTTAGDPPPFRCDGCKEPGTGTGRRYRCGAGCEFDLHTCCALAWPTLSHPLLGGDLVFTLLPGAPPVAADAAAAAALCITCGVWPAGLVYHCFDSRKKKKDIYLHPCCAALTTETVLAGGHRVQLCAEAKLRCVVCGEKKEHGHHFFSSGRKLWAYRWFHSAAGEEGSYVLPARGVHEEDRRAELGARRRPRRRRRRTRGERAGRERLAAAADTRRGGRVAGAGLGGRRKHRSAGSLRGSVSIAVILMMTGRESATL